MTELYNWVQGRYEELWELVNNGLEIVCKGEDDEEDLLISVKKDENDNILFFDNEKCHADMYFKYGNSRKIAFIPLCEDLSLQWLPQQKVAKIIVNNSIFQQYQPTTYTCSSCNNTTESKSNYCPNCGAKFIKKEQDNENNKMD